MGGNTIRRLTSQARGAYPRDLPNAVVQILEAGHFALDTAADEIAQRIREFHEVADHHESMARSTYPRPVWY